MLQAFSVLLTYERRQQSNKLVNFECCAFAFVSRTNDLEIQIWDRVAQQPSRVQVDIGRELHILEGQMQPLLHEWCTGWFCCAHFPSWRSIATTASLQSVSCFPSPFNMPLPHSSMVLAFVFVGVRQFKVITCGDWCNEVVMSDASQ